MDDPFTDGYGHGHNPGQPTSGNTLPAKRGSHKQKPQRTGPGNHKSSLEVQLNHANTEIQIRDAEIARLKAEVNALKVRVGRQEVTIRNQSKIIQDPRSLRTRRLMNNYPVSQPPGLQIWPLQSQASQPYVDQSQPYVDQSQSYIDQSQPYKDHAAASTKNQQTLRGPPHGNYSSQYQMIVTSPTMQQQTFKYPPYGYAQQPVLGTTHGHHTYHVHTGQTNFAYATNGHHDPDGTAAGARLQGLFEPLPPLRQQTLQAANAQRPLHETIINSDQPPLEDTVLTGDPAYAGIEFETKSTELAGRFRELWAKSDHFAKTYGVGGETLHPQHLAARLKDHMMIDANVDIAIEFLNNPVTRPLYVAKVVNFYLCKDMLKYTEVVRGYDSAIDTEITNYKKKISHDTPGGVKYRLLGAIAKQVVTARQSPEFEDFARRYQDNQAYQLRSLLGPLLFPGGSNSAAQDLLKGIVKEAHELGLDLYSLPYDARFHFPEIDESFDPTIMLNLDVNFDIAVMTNAKVKMSVTPAIRLGLNQYTPARVRNVSTAKVFTKLPDSDEDGPGRTPGRVVHH